MSTNPLLDDRFLVLETLGSGGMGRVYRAFDRVEARIVAVKVLFHDGESGPRHPLSAEYVAWSRLRHPNIVRAYELGRAERGPFAPGTPYLVMESFTGLPADRALRPGRVRPAHLEEFARRVLQALDHVHGAGLVHRDLKPGNVLVAGARRGPGRTKLTDFGLAAEIGHAGPRGYFSGSVPYAAPESVVGRPVDGRTDLYGLGILLFFLATGRMPVQSRDPHEVLRWHLQGPPADPRSLSPHLPDRLVRFIRRVTQRIPDERPSSAEEALCLLGRRGAPSTPLDRRPPRKAEQATLRLALDAVRLGAHRRLHLPADRPSRAGLLTEAGVRSQVHGLLFYRLRSEPRRNGSNLGKLVLRLLVNRGPRVRALIARHGLQRGLPLGLLGGLPVWDRMRANHRIDPADELSLRATARGVAGFLLASSERQAMVLVVERGALADPLTRRVVDLLVREVESSDRKLPVKGGLLLLLPPSLGERRPARRAATSRVASLPRRSRGSGSAPSSPREAPDRWRRDRDPVPAARGMPP